MKHWYISWDALLVMSVVVVAGVCSQSQQVAHAEDEAKEEGRVVQISPDAKEVEPLSEGLPAEQPIEEPTYWIGIRGRGVQSPVLRTHLQLAEDMGVVIEEVIKESPAAKAGLRKHDIVLRANGNAVHGMKVLLEQVREHQEKPIELKVIRLGKEETLVVVPEQRPHQLATNAGDPLQGLRGRFGGGGASGRADALRQLMEQLQRDGGLQAGVRMLGPGIVLDGNQFGQQAMPDGVSLSITRKNGEPAKITIKRGEQTWEVVEGDQEAIQQLPEDLRPFVERSLQQGQGGMFGGMKFDFDKGLEDLLPRGFGAGGGFGGGGVVPAPRKDLSRHEKELAERLERLEKDLRKLQERLLEQEPVTVEELPTN